MTSDGGAQMIIFSRAEHWFDFVASFGGKTTRFS